MTRHAATRLAAALALFLALHGPAAAQSSASTLARLTDLAGTIAEVKVLSNRVDGDRRYVTLKRLRVLKGSLPALPATFTLEEHAGQACGSALHGLMPGTGLLAFLAVSGSGVRLALPGPRSLAPLHADVRAQVQDLLRAPNGAARIAVLTRALAANHPRVRHDAALALPLTPDLARAGAADRQRVLAAMTAALDAGERQATSLLAAARRLQLASAARVLLPRYLAGRTPGLEPLLAPALAELDPTGVVAALRTAPPTGSASQRRAVRLLSLCNTSGATACLTELLRNSGHGVRVHAAAALLERGVAPGTIRQQAGADVLETSQRLLARQRRGFRSIQPRGTRAGR